jgi:Lrp/AsnC family transcriptional regulator for asnA, asnC and gidA
MKLDDKDSLILSTLAKNSRLSTYQISKQTGIPVTTVHNRIKRLEEQKIIKGYTIDVDHKKLKNDVIVHLLIKYDMNEMEHAGLNLEELTKRFKKIPEIETISYVTGRFDIILKVRLKSIRNLGTLVLNRIRKIPGILHTESIYSLYDESIRRV